MGFRTYFVMMLQTQLDQFHTCKTRHVALRRKQTNMYLVDCTKNNCWQIVGTTKNCVLWYRPADLSKCVRDILLSVFFYIYLAQPVSK